jgi:hypothetical protein
MSTPAQAGEMEPLIILDSRLRGNREKRRKFFNLRSLYQVSKLN